MTRRTAIAALTAARSTLQAAGGAKPGCQTNAWKINPANFDELLAVLAKVRNFGYLGFETSFRNVQSQFADPAGAKQQFAKLGLKFLNIHVFLNEYDSATRIAPPDLIERVARGGAALQAERLVLSGGPCGENGKFNAPAAAAKSAALNKAGELCRGLGIRAAYHNHGPEFADGGREMLALARDTDPKLVDFVIDAGHGMKAGGDVLGFFRANHKRIAGMHVRDFRGEEQLPLGQGSLDYQPLAKAIRAAKWQGWLINEEERLNDVKPGDSAIGPARESMKRIFGV